MIRRRHRLDPSERLRRVLALPPKRASCALLLTAVEDVSLDVARAALRRLVRQAIVEALAGREDAADQALLPLVADPSGDVRLGVARALVRSPRPDAQRALVRLASDPDPVVRHAATMLREEATDGP